MISLRDYQLETIKNIAKLYREGIRRQLAILPTGAGKTVIFSHLTKRVNKRTLVLAHREELLEQAREKMKLVWPEAEVGIVQAKRNEWDKQIVVASVQTLSRPERLAKINKNFALIIADETHHATSPSWRAVLKALGCFEPNGPLTVGFTATPNRTDNVGLGEIFQKVAIQKSILDMMIAGYLADIKAIRVNTKIDLSGVKIIGGDYSEDELAKRVNTEERNNIIVKAFLEQCPNRKAIAFAANIAHAEALADLFNKHGITSKAVSSKNTREERRNILRAYHNDEIQVLTNNNLLIEGYDEPKVNCIILARPTQSESFYIQMAGRGLRLYPGKSDCLLLDVADNTIAHNVLSVPRIFGMTDAQVERMSKEGTSVLAEKAKEKLQFTGKANVSYSVENIEIFAGSIFNWVFNGKSYFLVLPDDEMIALQPDAEDNTKYNIVHYKGTTTRNISNTPMPAEWGQGVAEGWIRRNRLEAMKVLRRNASWKNDPASKGQIETLEKAGQIVQKGLTKGDASRAISLLIATAKERRAMAEKTGNETQNKGIPKKQKDFLLDLLRDRHLTLNIKLSELDVATAGQIINAIIEGRNHPLIFYPYKGASN